MLTGRRGLAASRQAGTASTSAATNGTAPCTAQHAGSRACQPSRKSDLSAGSGSDVAGSGSTSSFDPPPGYVFMPRRDTAQLTSVNAGSDGRGLDSRGRLKTSMSPAQLRQMAAAAVANMPPKVSPPSTQLSTSMSQIIDVALGEGSAVWAAGIRRGPIGAGLPPDLIRNVKKYSNQDVSRKVGELAKVGMFDAALELIRDISLAPWRISYKYFMRYAALYRASKAALGFLRALPKRYHHEALYTMVLGVCATSRDLETGLAAVELADKLRFHLDTKMLTSLIKVCATLGNANRAFRVFADMKSRKLTLDSHAYGVLIHACAEAMQRHITVVHERKEQYVLLERALNLVVEAEAANIKLDTPAWNALLACAGRCGQLARAFEVLEMMQEREVLPNATTYGALMEACVRSKQSDMALRLYRTALAQGFTKHVKVYTQAISACMVDGAVDLPRAFEIYNNMQRNGVEPDKKLYACLMAVAGKTGSLHVSCELLTNMIAEGIPLHSTICSALMHACLLDRNLAAARQVYDLCRQHNVFPMVSQYNRIMDWYAVEGRFGEVVSLLDDMVAAGRVPNVNTYRILLNACQRSDQAQLALQIYALMKANRMNILQESFVNTIYYTLMKCCFNQARYSWCLGGYPPRSHAAPVARLAEAQKVLKALGVQRHSVLLHSFMSVPADGVNWAQQAVNVYRDMISQGHRPNYDMLDLLMGCLRTKLKLPEKPAASSPERPGNSSSSAAKHLHGTPGLAGRSAASGPVSKVHPGSDGSTVTTAASAEQQRPDSTYEVPFDRRALQLLEDAIGRGLLPSLKPEEQGTVDLRPLPPSLAEVYVLHLLMLIEKRAERDGLRVKDAGYFKSVTLLVPPFNPDLINWPSFVKKLTFHYKQQERDEDATANAAKDRHWARLASGQEATSSGEESDTELRLRNNGNSSHGGGTWATPAAFARSAAASSNGHSQLDGTSSMHSTHHVSNGKAYFNLTTLAGLRAAAEASNSKHSIEPRANGNSEGQSSDGGHIYELRLASSAADTSSFSNSNSSSNTAGSPSDVARRRGAHSGGRSTTGLAVAATLKRMKCWVQTDAARGMLILDQRELLRWIREKQTYDRRIRSHVAQNQAAGSSTAGVGASVPNSNLAGNSSSLAGASNSTSSSNGIGLSGLGVIGGRVGPAIMHGFSRSGASTGFGGPSALAAGQAPLSHAVLRQRQNIRMSLMSEPSTRLPSHTHAPEEDANLCITMLEESHVTSRDVKQEC